MEINELTSKEYKSIFSQPYHIFNTADFNELNSYKCNKVIYLMFKDEKPQLGLILGQNDNSVCSPFSAPFGGFSFINERIQHQHIDTALELLDKYLISKSIESIKIAVPPLFYNNLFLPKFINSLSRDDYNLYSVELNYDFNTEKFDQNYENNLHRNAKKNLKTSFKHNLIFEKTTDLKAAYDVIAINRTTKGFPLRMTFEQMKETSELVPIDNFLIKYENILIAAAIVFHVAPGIVQVIYWGDVPDYSSMRTMNFLSYKIFEYYKSTGIKNVDIGPSTKNGVPNFGLCEFKESIGCDLKMKLVFEKQF